VTTVPITIRLATKLTKETHRREPSLTGALWSIGLLDAGAVIGCAVVGCPKARKMDGPADKPKETLEVLRVAVPEGIRTNGHGGACSSLYGASARTAKSQGAKNLFTYTHADEPGTSLRAAGWIREEEADGTPIVFGGGQWGRDSRPRKTRKEDGPKHRWWAPWSIYLGFRRLADPSSAATPGTRGPR
jgi:hypothetical protein